MREIKSWEDAMEESEQRPEIAALIIQENVGARCSQNLENIFDALCAVKDVLIDIHNKMS